MATNPCQHSGAGGKLLAILKPGIIFNVIVYTDDATHRLFYFMLLPQAALFTINILMVANTRKIVIIGGGFAGLNLIMELENKAGIEVILVDSNNYNFFPPLLYQVATGFLEPSAISYPFRKFLRDKNNIRFLMGNLQKIVPEENKVILSNGELSYDDLVIATGAETNYFGMKNVKQHAIPMKTLSDALAMRNFLLKHLEKTARVADKEERKKLTTFVVAGAGPTGVEVSGMFAEMKKDIILKDYPELQNEIGPVYLVDGGKAVLGPMSAASQEYSKKSLEQLGIHIKLNVTVKDYKDDMVYLSDGTSIATKVLIWAAGVSGKIFDGIPQDWYGRGKRLLTDAYNKVLGSENIYALGDACYQSHDPAFSNGHPQVAQVAIQQAKNLGKNFLRKPTAWQSFIYNDKGSMAIIGRNKAVADIPKPKMHFNGFIAWIAWVFVHIMSLLTYRNRLRTLYNWIGAYVNKDQSFRMIIKPEEK